MSNAGWYPDPGGQPGLYRYWTGTAWTTAVTTNPQGTRAPDPSALGAPPSQGKPKLGWWTIALAGLTVVALVVWIVFQGFGIGGSGSDDPQAPGGIVTPNICPPATEQTMLPTTDPDAGWITGGRLAFPALGAPWQTSFDDRVPFGSLAMVQEVLDQENYDNEGHSWVASILVSDLFVGDGFANTKSGAEIVLKCVLGKYYADTVVDRADVTSKAHSVDGHDGWLIETQLNFQIPGLITTGERVLLLVVQTAPEEYGLFYASIPDTREYLLPDARTALAGLRIKA